MGETFTSMDIGKVNSMGDCSCFDSSVFCFTFGEFFFFKKKTEAIKFCSDCLKEARVARALEFDAWSIFGQTIYKNWPKTTRQSGKFLLCLASEACSYL